MNRTTILKIGTAALLLAVLWAASMFAMRTANPALTFAIIGVLCLLPGRVQGYLWRDLFTGRKLFAKKRYRDALPYFEQMYAALLNRPALRHAIWLGWSTYSLSLEVMTLTNIGGCKLMLGELSGAQSALEMAIQLDPKAPLPHFNLAQLHAARGEREEAARFAVKARDLGFYGSLSDDIVRISSEAYAAVEGRIKEETETTEKSSE